MARCRTTKAMCSHARRIPVLASCGAVSSFHALLIVCGLLPKMLMQSQTHSLRATPLLTDITPFACRISQPGWCGDPRPMPGCTLPSAIIHHLLEQAHECIACCPLRTALRPLTIPPLPIAGIDSVPIAFPYCLGPWVPQAFFHCRMHALHHLRL